MEQFGQGQDNLVTGDFIAKWKKSTVVKIGAGGFILLILLIPLTMTSGLRNSRAIRATSVEQEISAKWGGPQTVSAPALEVNIVKDGTSKRVFAFPEELDISVVMTPEVRSRGIYQALLYKSESVIKGHFIVPEIADGWKISGSKSNISIDVSEIKGITGVLIKASGKELSLTPGRSGFNGMLDAATLKPGARVPFEIKLELNGCRQLFFKQQGNNFSLKIASTWASPSFDGDFLPAERKVTDDGFYAVWKPSPANLNSGIVGVNLVLPANRYQQVERVHEYAVVLIAVVLIAFMLCETATKVWMHPLQYFFVGLSLALFYLLLLSLSEHISFTCSYIVSAAVITLMTSGYSAMIFEKKKTVPLIFGFITALAYTLIFMLIRLEEYALLTGSIILLAILAVLMKFTGKINR